MIKSLRLFTKHKLSFLIFILALFAGSLPGLPLKQQTNVDHIGGYHEDFEYIPVFLFFAVPERGRRKGIYASSPLQMESSEEGSKTHHCPPICSTIDE